MKRLIFAALACAALTSVGCGGGPSPSSSPSSQPTTQPCIPPLGAGTVGACTPKPKVSLAPKQTRGALIPDVSGYQGCPNWPRGIPGVIFKVYEGNWHQDPSAGCNAHRLKQIGAWDAAYTFLRPGSCVGQADTTVAIVKGIGGVSGPLIADAEVPLPPGFVTCFVERLHHDTGNYAQIIYTAPGTWPGGPLARALWVATYGSRPGCVAGVCGYSAWQFTDKGCAYGLCGDLSVDNGITRFRQQPPVDKSALKARQKTLRRVLATYGCRRRRHAHIHLGPRCARWFHEGDVVTAKLAS